MSQHEALGIRPNPHLVTTPVTNNTNELPGGKKPRKPFEDDGDSSDRVFLEALDDLRGLVPIDPMDGATLDHLGRAPQTVVQPELVLVFGRHPGKFLLHAFQHTNCGQVGLQDDV